MKQAESTGRKGVQMNWPDWGDVLPTLALLIGMAGSVVGAFWALLRMFQPVAERAARDAVDSLYERLKANDFRRVEDGLKALGDRIDRMGEDICGRLDRWDKRLEGRIDRMGENIGERLDRWDKRLEGGFDRMRLEVGERLEEVDKRFGDQFDRIRLEFGERLQEVDERFGERLQEVDERLSGRLDRADKRLREGLDRARTDRQEMEARLLTAIRELGGPEQVVEA